MKIAQKYSHLNGEEFLLVHHGELYAELLYVISLIDAEVCKTKISNERKISGNTLYSPIDLNRTFRQEFSSRGWKESRYQYYITLDRDLMEQSINI